MHNQTHWLIYKQSAADKSFVELLSPGHVRLVHGPNLDKDSSQIVVCPKREAAVRVELFLLSTLLLS